MKSRIVRNAQELKKAKKENVEEIIVVGEFAKELLAAKKITTLSKVALGTLTAALGAGTVLAPVTGGASLPISMVAAAPLAASTGLSIPVIVLVSVVGIPVILSLFKDYDSEVDVSSGGIKLKFTKR